MKYVMLAGFFLAGSLFAGGPKWLSKDYTKWTKAEAEKVLSDSPWSHQANGFFGTTDEDPREYPVESPSPRDAGLGGRAVSDGKWDGGVGKMQTGGTPTLPVTVRWDSALPIRAALLDTKGPELRDTEHSLEQPDKYYVLTVIGLAPGKTPEAPRNPDLSDNPEPQHRVPFDPVQVRQGLMNWSRLLVRNRKPIVPQDVRYNQDTGVIQVFFPKSEPITENDKEVTFVTTYGSIKVTQRFRLKDMVYKGKLEL